MKGKSGKQIKKKSTPAWRDHSRSKRSNPKAIDLLSAQGQFGSAVEQMVRRKRWDEIIEILKPALGQHRNEFWVHMQLAFAYLEKFKRNMAVDHGYEAFQLNQSSMFVTWLWSRHAFQCKIYDEVVMCCDEIIQEGEATILLDPYCKDLATAETLVNDCHYLLATTYKIEKMADLAEEEMKK